MGNSVLRRCLSAIQLLILSSGSILYAADVDFRISSGVGYDSNVFRSATDPEQDLYLRLTPKLALIMPFYRTYFALNSRAVLEQHMNRTGANLLELVLSGVGRYKLSNHISFMLQDQIIVSDRLRAAEILTDVPIRREFVSNRISSSLRHELRTDVLAISLGYANSIRYYRDEQEGDDWVLHSGEFRIDYSVGHKTSTRLIFSMVKKDYEVDVGYLSFPVTASLRRRLSNKFAAGLSLGVDNRRYSESHEERDWDEPNVSLDITGSLTPKTASSLKLQRKVYDSDFAVGYTYISKAAILTLVLNLSDAAQLSLSGLYSRNEYMRFRWTSDVYEGRAKIQYRLVKWGAIAMGYGHENWSSKFLDTPGYDYNKHLIDLSYVIMF